MNRTHSARLLRSLLWVVLAALPSYGQAIEEPRYEVIGQIGDVELRQYAPYVVAEVVLDSTPEDAGRRAFPILAGYIFGKNKGQQRFAMSAPVTQTAVPIKMEMSAPVTQTTTPGGMRVQFVLPRDVTLESAPEPLDARVQLRLVAARQWAAVRYPGAWSQANDDDQLGKLQATLAAAGVVTLGQPVLARYNGPMTPGFMRRNEIWLALQ